MGKAVEEAARGAEDIDIRARVDRSPEPGPQPSTPGYQPPSAKAVLGIEELPRILSAGDVVIEFSSVEGAGCAALACAERGAGLVSGTTGLGEDGERAMREAATRVPVLRAANFSIGLLALRNALAAALEALPRGWDVEIVERHHRKKVDSPSGTAEVLARDAASHRGLDDSAIRHGRHGRVGPRREDEIGVHSVRGGTWVGDHAVLISGEGESLELRHVAEDRAAFAHGAVAAARFVAAAPPGLYDLRHVLGSRGRI
jgi:4-hydroxy-tetrahydrodipicolinate reductase